MSADEFWKDDPQLFVSYRTSFINKKKREAEELDYKCWLQGLYVYDGIRKIISSLKQFIGNIVASFSKGASKDNRPIDTYPKKPFTEIEKEEKEKEIKKLNYKQHEEALLYYGTLKQQYIKKMQAKKGE